MGILGDVARTAVVAGTWTAVSNRVSRRQAGRWAAEDQAKANPPGYMPPPPGRYQRPMFQQHARAAYPIPNPTPIATPPPTVAPTYVVAAPAPDPMSMRLEHLKRLGELKAQGVLTDEEFQAQKAAILSAS